MQTEGLGGPCPRCGAMNCFIKKGTGTWYDFIACPECLFAYGENADNMREETGGVVTGVDVWDSLIHAHAITSKDEFDEFFDFDEENQYTVESPFDFSNEEEWTLNLCVVSEKSLELMFQAAEEKEKIV